MHDKRVVHISPTNSVWSICPWPAVYTSAWSVTRGRWCWMLLRGCSHALSSPGIAKEHLSTWTKEQRSWFPFFFSSACWLLSWPEPPGPSGEPCSSVGKAPTSSCHCPAPRYPTIDPPLFVFLSLLISETSFLWSTILHWPRLQCCRWTLLPNSIQFPVFAKTLAASLRIISH